MARDLYETTVALPDATGTLKVLEGVKVSVVPRGAVDVANSLVDIYASDIGVTRGPDPKSGATGTKVITTGASGSVRFWAEAPAEYDLIFEDSIAPARIFDRVGWNAVPAKPGTIPTSALAADGGITQKMLSPEVVRQEVPIGGVIEWWRPPPSGSNPPSPPPDGYEIADGRSVSQHDFPGVSGTISLPNLVNAFILGATLTKSDGAGADQADSAASGPGIRGTGGSNVAKNITHTHAVPGIDHLHGVAGQPAGALYVPDHAHWFAANTGNNTRDAGTKASGGSGEGLAYTAHAHYVAAATNGSGAIGVIGSTPVNDRPLNSTAGAITWVANPGNDFRPAFYGLLRIIKVRRA